MFAPLALVLASQITLDPVVEAAANHALRGEPLAAQALADVLVRQQPNDPAALLVRLCLELEAGDFQKAQLTSIQLAAAAPDTPEALVLGALLSRREANPHGPWLHDLLAALRAVEGHNLAKPLLTRAPTTLQAIPASQEASLAPAEIFLVHYTDKKRPPGLPEEARALSGSDLPLVVSLAVLDVLLSDRSDASSVMAARSLGARLGAKYSNDPMRRLGALLAGTDSTQAFTAEETLALTKALAEGGSTPPFRELFDECRVIFARIDPAQADVRAFLGTASVYPFPEWIVLYRRARTTLATPHAARQKPLGSVMRGVGEILASEPFLISLRLTRLALDLADDLSEDPEARAEAAVSEERFRTAYAASTNGLKLVSEIVIPSLQREIFERLTRNEIETIELFTAPNPK